LRNAVVTVLLAAVAFATWLWSRPPPAEAVRRVAGDSTPLGYYLHGARLIGTDDSGRIAYRILADRLEELPDQQQLRLDGVQVEYRPADAVPWLISAKSGNAPKDGSLLDLDGDVLLRSEPTDGSEPLVITTKRMRFEPESSSVQSDQAVQIRIGDWHLDAVGLRTHLKGDKLELESDVHGKFAP
jgi:LPS export ABC transporter protein LptC